MPIAGWKIKERIGNSLWQIHAGKVPMYESKLSKSMDRYFVKLRVDSAIQRFNFAIDISPELFHIEPHHNLDPAMLNANGKKLQFEDLYLRVERQVLQRLPRSRAMIFSLRTYVTPLGKVLEDHEVARGLRTCIRTFSPELGKYKNQALWNDLVEEKLAEVLEDE